MQMDVQPQRGVLWKRRDVFKNSWRPRWFDLQPNQGLLTYYLLTSYSTSTVSAASPTSTPSGTIGSINRQLLSRSSSLESSSYANSLPSTPILPLPRDISRSRATSWDSTTSNVSENSIDYDVVPRGSIFLWGSGCTVSINEKLTKPNDNLFAFSIRPLEPSIRGNENNNNSSDPISVLHLAARTAELRDIWIQKIRRVCHFGRVNNTTPGRLVTTSVDNTPYTPTRRRSRSRSRLNQHDPYLQLQEPIIEESQTDVNSLGAPDGEDPSSEIDSPLRPHSRHDAVEISQEVSRPSPPNWESDDDNTPDSSIFANVPSDLVKLIKDRMTKYLALLSENTDNKTNIEWKRLSILTKHGHSDLNLKAFQTKYNGFQDENGDNKYSLIKSEAILPHSPKQIFNLISDRSRRKQYETNLNVVERMKQYNPHVALDYYASESVWPTTAREFTVVSHWQVLTRKSDNEKAICMISFSCPEAEAERPTSSNHVRATLLVSMYLIIDIGNSKSRLMRLLSYDLAGNVSQQLANVVLTQQANLPAVISDYLNKMAGVPVGGRLGDLSNEDIRENIVLAREAMNGNLPTIHPLNGVHVESETGSDSNTYDDGPSVYCGPVYTQTFFDQASLLFMPLFLHQVLVFCNFRFVAVPLFCLVAFLAMRQIIRGKLRIVQGICSQHRLIYLGSVRCTFTVDLKGVLRFISNHKEEQTNGKDTGADVSVLHIVAAALARALREEKVMSYRRVCIPWFMINDIVDASGEPVHVSILENTKIGLVTLKSVDDLSVQNIADGIRRIELEELDRGQKVSSLGQCLVVLKSQLNSEDGIDLNVTLRSKSYTTVVAEVGDVHLERRKQKKGSSTQNGAPKPVLTISLVITPPDSIVPTDVTKYTKFANEVRKLIQYPEMCDQSI